MEYWLDEMEHWSIEQMLAFGKLLSEPQQEWRGFMPKYQVTPDMQARIDNNFTYHAPKDDQPSRYAIIRENAKNLAICIVENSPASREQSLALTALEEVVFQTNAAIARNEK